MQVDASTKALAVVALETPLGWADNVCFRCVANGVTLSKPYMRVTQAPDCV